MNVWTIDPVYLWYVFIPILVISIRVQLYLKIIHVKWSRVKNHNGLTGVDVGQQLFATTPLKAVPLQYVSGTLSDHFDPGANVVRLASSAYANQSVTAIAVTAHELRHVQQYQTDSGMIKARGFLLPALQFSPMISYFTVMFGLFWNMTNLLWIGIGFFGLMVLFSILTLPIELNASRRGIKLLQKAGLLKDPQDSQDARQMLNAPL